VGWSDLRTAARRTVHATFGEPFPYTAPGETVSSVDVVVRHRTRVAIHGGEDNEYATLQEGVNRLIFSSEDLAAKGVTLRRGGRVVVPPFTLELDQPEPVTGPIEVPWSVVTVDGD
jgi:hypothetical protein